MKNGWYRVYALLLVITGVFILGGNMETQTLRKLGELAFMWLHDLYLEIIIRKKSSTTFQYIGG